jgi:hypothetical protein
MYGKGECRRKEGWWLKEDKREYKTNENKMINSRGDVRYC